MGTAGGVIGGAIGGDVVRAVGGVVGRVIGESRFLHAFFAYIAMPVFGGSSRARATFGAAAMILEDWISAF